jgi:hypothetical protein
MSGRQDTWWRLPFWLQLLLKQSQPCCQLEGRGIACFDLSRVRRKSLPKKSQYLQEQRFEASLSQDQSLALRTSPSATDQSSRCEVQRKCQKQVSPVYFLPSRQEGQGLFLKQLVHIQSSEETACHCLITQFGCLLVPVLWTIYAS